MPDGQVHNETNDEGHRQSCQDRVWYLIFDLKGDGLDQSHRLRQNRLQPGLFLLRCDLLYLAAEEAQHGCLLMLLDEKWHVIALACVTCTRVVLLPADTQVASKYAKISAKKHRGTGKLQQGSNTGRSNNVDLPVGIDGTNASV